MRKQEEFMAHLDVPGILEELNQELLGGKGEIALSYSNRGTSLLLQIDPSAGDNSPELLIGLVGDQNKFAAGEEDYMTNMAIMYLQERNAEALIQAYNDSTKAPNRLPIIVDPSLNPDRYTPEQWDKFHDITKERAAKILKEKLAEGPVMRPQGETSPTTVQHGWGFSHFDDFEYIKRIVDNNFGSDVGTTEEKEAFVRRTMRKQEAFLEQYHVQELLQELNRTLLQGKGESGLIYGGTHNNGETTSTKLYLQLDPSQGDNYPRLMIGLVGDGKKFLHAEDNYMTHLAVMYIESYNEKELARVEERAKMDWRSVEINPSLAPDLGPTSVSTIQEQLKEAATALLREKLAEQKRRDPERRLRRLGKIVKPIGAIGGAVVAIGGAATFIENETHVLENVIIPALRRLPFFP